MPTIFLANYAEHLVKIWRTLANAGGVRPSSCEFAGSSPSTGERAKKIVTNCRRMRAEFAVNDRSPVILPNVVEKVAKSPRKLAVILLQSYNLVINQSVIIVL
jgi:hypothetical protein